MHRTSVTAVAAVCALVIATGMLRAQGRGGASAPVPPPSADVRAKAAALGAAEEAIIARGPVLIHVINGRVTAILIDEDPQNRDLEGLLGFQMHVGGPFKVQYRNILYRALP